MSCLHEICQLSMTDRRAVASLRRRASRLEMVKWGRRIVVSLVAVTSVPMIASQLVVNVTSVNPSGTDQSASGLWDSGVVTVTVNGRAESVPYGQFSTTAAIASGIAARFSLDCNSPVTAKASGNAITFVEKSPNGTDIQLNAAIEWNSSTFSQASFEVPMDGPPSQLPGGPYSVSLPIKCTPNPVPNGMSAVCSTQMPPGLQVEPTGTVAFQLDGGSVWSVANVDNTGLAISDGLSSVAQGAHTVTATYSGDANYLGTSDTFSPLNGQSSSTVQPATLYSYNITSYQVNGNLLSYNDSVNGSWTLGYDNLNRLTSSSQTPVGSMTQYGCWSYDSFGNRMNQTIASQPPTPVSCTAPQGSTPYGVTTISYVPGTNQIGTGSWRNAQGIFTPDGAPAYDSAGHMISMPGDPVNPYTGAVNTYMYDPDGHICAALLPSGALEGYLYNAEGQRVAKGTLTSFTCDAATNGFQIQTTANGSVVQPNVQEIYIIGPDGSEMTGLDGAGNWSHVNVSAVGQMIATYTNDGMGVHFQLADWLGTHRVQTDYLGQVEGSCQSQPFGDGMTCFGGVASDHKFTGKERDTESGLDYFKYRYYASSMGRWMSPDPSGLTHAGVENPQSLNLYNYVGNNPLTRVDLDGLCWKGFEWACNLGHAIENGLQNLGQSFSNARAGVGFHTDKTVIRNLHNANVVLQGQGVNTEGMSEKDILSRAKRGPEPSPLLTAGSDILGLSGTLVELPKLVERGNAAASIANDPDNKLNVGVQLLGLVKPFGKGMAVTGAYADAFEYGAYNSSGTVTDHWKDGGPSLDPDSDASEPGADVPSSSGTIGSGAGGGPSLNCRLLGDC